MSFQFLNSERDPSKGSEQKSYNKPQEVLDDVYLTPIQKRMVLEAMLMEARDDNGEELKPSRQMEEILKVKIKLQQEMD